MPVVPRPKRRYEALVDSILELVELRGLKSGEALPTERELSEEFGVSRNVLRQAFGILEERGLLRTVQGSGRYLREGALDDPLRRSSRESVELASIADVLEARALIEVQVAGLACERRTIAQARALTSYANTLTSWEDNLAFHCAVAEATQNFVLERLVRQQAELAGELHQREHYQDPQQLELMLAEHVAIAAAISSRDRARAERLMRAHLQSTRDLVLDTSITAD